MKATKMEKTEPTVDIAGTAQALWSVFNDPIGMPAFDGFSPDVVAYRKRKIASTVSHRSAIA